MSLPPPGSGDLGRLPRLFLQVRAHARHARFAAGIVRIGIVASVFRCAAAPFLGHDAGDDVASWLLLIAITLVALGETRRATRRMAASFAELRTLAAQVRAQHRAEASWQTTSSWPRKRGESPR